MGVIFVPKHMIWKKATMCAYPQSDHVLLHWKWVLRCCTKCQCVNISDQETDDQYYNTTPFICFQIYHIIACCTAHVRLPYNAKTFCGMCRQDSASEQSTKP